MRRLDLINREVDLYASEAESWRQDHSDALQVRDWEDLIAFSIVIYDKLIELDLDVRSETFKSLGVLDDSGICRIEEMCARWLEVSKVVLAVVKQFEDSGYVVEQATRFKECVHEITSALTPDDQFFTGEGLAILQDRAIAEYKAGLFTEV